MQRPCTALQQPIAARRPCSSQLPPERPAAAKTCRQTALQQPTAARETCNSKDPAPLPTFRKTSSAPHRVHLVAVPVHPVPPSQQIRSSRHRPPRTLSSLLDLPILTSPDPANHLDLPILTSPHPANHLFDLQPIVKVQQDRTVCVQNCGLHCSCSEGFPHHWQENTSARGVGRLCLRCISNWSSSQSLLSLPQSPLFSVHPPCSPQSPRPLPPLPSPHSPPPRPPLVSKPPPPQSTGTINGGASLSQPPQLPVSPKHTFSSTSLFPFLGSSHPPQDNRCCCLESRALRKHKSKTSCAQTISQYVLLNSAYENMFY